MRKLESGRDMFPGEAFWHTKSSHQSRDRGKRKGVKTENDRIRRLNNTVNQLERDRNRISPTTTSYSQAHNIGTNNPHLRIDKSTDEEADMFTQFVGQSGALVPKW